MKTKLLKKVRKQFTIYHLKNGVIDPYNGKHHDFNLFRLDNRYNEYQKKYAQVGVNPKTTTQFTNNVFNTEEECIYFLKKLIIKYLREKGYRGIKDKKIKNSLKKVWYI